MDCIARQAPLSMEFLRQEYWSGLLFPSPGDLPDPGTEPTSPALAGGFFTTEPPEKPYFKVCVESLRPSPISRVWLCLAPGALTVSPFLSASISRSLSLYISAGDFPLPSPGEPPKPSGPHPGPHRQVGAG